MSEEEYDYSKVNKFTAIAAGSVFWGFIATVVVWKICGKGFFIDLDKSLDINFYAALSGTLSIIGLGVAIWQIAELKDRQEAIKEVVEERLNTLKKVNHLKKLTAIKQTIEETKTLVSDGNWAEVSKNISSYRDSLIDSGNICPDIKDMLDEAGKSLLSFQKEVNNERYSQDNKIDRIELMNELDGINEIFGRVIYICESI